MGATPAALPTDSNDPPTPTVSVTRAHCPSDIGGFMDRTVNMIGPLSMVAESRPTSTLAAVAPSLS
jgi:hypothetical protein